jgi:hypothetical protein
MLKIDLTSNELWGNEAGEDEGDEKLESYFLSKPEFAKFYSEKTKLLFVRAKKGLGKSALLKHALNTCKNNNSDDIFLYIKGSDLETIQSIESLSPSDMIRGWQQRICTRINYEIGARLKYAFSDDKINLVERAELAGFKSRNILRCLIDRIKYKVDIKTIPDGDSRALLQRVVDSADSHSVWLFIDDIDATFTNSEKEKLSISTFFSACRNLVNDVSGLRIRASVRTDVWHILSQFDEALDKCEQYMLDIKWSTAETGVILKNKILSYIKNEQSIISRDLLNADQKTILSLVFKEPFSWSKHKTDSFRPIHILSAGRPRWAAMLCKLGGQAALSYGNDKISINHISSQLRTYGRARIDDLYKEHRHQCRQLGDIIESFSGGPSRYTTSELLSHITDKIIKRKGFIQITGNISSSGSVAIAHFLFQIGFICARDSKENDSLGFVRFEDRPNLLTYSQNLDDGLPWEIHPSYREILRIKQG